MKVCVIGGSGFLGSFVCDFLTKKGSYVKIFDKKKSKFLKKKQKMVIGDITNFSLLKKELKKMDIVYNFAGLSNLEYATQKPFETIKYNIQGLTNILEACRINKVKRFIQASSIYALSEDGGFYSCSKRSGEDYIREYQKKYKLNFTILRYGSIFGLRSDENNGLYKIIENALKKRQLVYVGSSKTVRNYINVVDAAYLSIKILRKNFINKHVTLKGGKSIKLPFLLEKLGNMLKIKKKIFFKGANKHLGHYVINPSTYEVRKGISLKYSPKKSFYESILETINYVKNDIKKK